MNSNIAIGWFRIEAPYFVAGGEFAYDCTIIRAAPILHWTIGKGLVTVADWCLRKGYIFFSRTNGKDSMMLLP